MVDKNKTRWLSVRSTRERRRQVFGFKPHYRRFLPPGVKVTNTLVLEQIIDAGVAALKAQGIAWEEPPAELLDRTEAGDDEDEGAEAPADAAGAPPAGVEPGGVKP